MIPNGGGQIYLNGGNISFHNNSALDLQASGYLPIVNGNISSSPFSQFSPAAWWLVNINSSNYFIPLYQ